MSSFKKRVEARMAETGENWQQATLYVRSLAPREEPVTTLPLAILDTNVFLDIHSCHDVKNAIDGLHGRLGDAAIDEPAVTYRLARARESVLLAMYFHSVGATTFNLHNEAVDLLLKRSPPAAGGTTMESDFTTVFLHFVKDYVLPDRQPTMPTEPGTEAKNEADRALVAAHSCGGSKLAPPTSWRTVAVASASATRCTRS